MKAVVKAKPEPGLWLEEVPVPEVGGDDVLYRTIPFLPLDQVFTRGGIAVHELHAGSDDGSDHLPVAFTFSVKPMECCGPD